MSTVASEGHEDPAAQQPRGGPRSRLHPAKIRSGMRRRWFEYRLERTRLSPAGELAELGNPHYGGWTLPASLLEAGSVCYSVGAGGEISFDLDLIRRYGLTVRAVDPVRQYVERALADAEGDPRFSIVEAALATSDGPVRMQLTHDLGSESVSPAGLYDSASYVELTGRTLRSLMAEFGDSKIDVLKVDIEGGEYELVPTLDLDALGVKVFATQLHHTGSVAEARRLIRGLGEQRYEPVACHPAVKLAFARRDLIRDL